MRSAIAVKSGAALKLCPGVGGVLVTLVVAGAAVASPITPPWARDAEYSTYQAWDQFTDPPGPRGANLPNSPGGVFGPFVDAAPHNVNRTATLKDTTTTSFLTGTQNIYSPDEPLHVQVAVPHFDLSPAQYVTTVLVQTRTLGSEWIYGGAGGIRVEYADATGAHTAFAVAGGEQHREASGSDRGGDLVDYATLFDLPGSPSSYTLFFDGSASSLSADVVTVDAIVTRADAGAPLLPGMNPTVGYVTVAGVPEPGALLGVLGVVLMCARRTR
jgi:hypothetical protein